MVAIFYLLFPLRRLSFLVIQSEAMTIEKMTPFARPSAMYELSKDEMFASSITRLPLPPTRSQKQAAKVRPSMSL